MHGSESVLLSNGNLEKINHNTIEGGNETGLTSEFYLKNKRSQLPPNFEENFRVKSPQIMKIKMKIDDTCNNKNSHLFVNLKQGNNESPIRRDHNGTEIKSKNKKKIKISYRDKISELPLVDVVCIESLKEYNVNPFGASEESYAKTKQCCSCNIF